MFFIVSNYVDFNTAKAKNLTYTNDNTLILRADYTNIAGSRGRDTFRAVSTRSYKLHVAMCVWNSSPNGSMTNCIQLRCEAYARRLRHMAGDLGGGPG